jgi:hypothetical protein
VTSRGVSVLNRLSITLALGWWIPVALKAVNTNDSVKVFTQAGQNSKKKSLFFTGAYPCVA